MKVHLGKAVCECETVYECVYTMQRGMNHFYISSARQTPPPLHHHSQCTDLSQTVFASSLLRAAI